MSHYPGPRRLRSRPPRADVFLVTTETVAGWRVVRTLGYVEGPALLELSERARTVGANAVLCLRWATVEADSEKATDGSFTRYGTESFAYGTAVVIEAEVG